MINFIIKIFLAFSFTLLLSCGEINKGEFYDDLAESPDSFGLTKAEHEGGWGRTDCLTCHHLENIHIHNYSSESGISLIDIQNLTISGGESSCLSTSCHGTNGTY